MVYFSPCKINIGLKIIDKRADGFHNLKTIFYAIPFYDIIEILPSADFKITITGIDIPSNGKPNLCEAAFNLLKANYPSLPNVHILLHKQIPAGAGLGGGSANAAIILKALNSQFNLGISQNKLLSYALSLGSDCPFFIHDSPCIGEGRGEVLKPINLPLHNYFIYLINPKIHISTATAFSNLQLPTNSIANYEKIDKHNISHWQNECINDFETCIFKLEPKIEAIKNELLAHGAVYASMSGTGSTVYGIFKTKPNNLPLPAEYLQIITALK